MICTSTSGITIKSSERPNIVCGSSRLIRLRWRMSRSAGASPGASPPNGAIGASAAASLGLERIAGAPHGLQVAGIARIELDLAAQPRHLHIDIADVAAELRRLRQILARYRLAGARREAGEEPRFGGGQVDDLAAAKQLAAVEVEAKSAEADRARRLVRDRAALDDVADPQDQLARFERFGQEVVGAPFEPVDPVFGFGHRGQQQNREAGAPVVWRTAVAAQRTGKVEPAFAGHHHVEHNEVEGKARQIGARLLGVGRDRHAKPVLRQIAAQQVAQPRIVIDDKKVRFDLAHRRALYAKSSLSPTGPLLNPPRQAPTPPPFAGRELLTTLLRKRGREGPAPLGVGGSGLARESGVQERVASSPRPAETSAILLGGDDREQHLAEPLDRRRTGLLVRGGDPGALQLRQAALQLAADIGQFEEALAAVLDAAVLDDEALAQQLAQYPVEALLGNAQDAEQLADRHLRMPPDKMHDPVMGAPEPVLHEDRIGFGGEVAIGEKQQLDAFANRLLAWRPRIGAGLFVGIFYVSHIDLSGKPSVQAGC